MLRPERLKSQGSTGARLAHAARVQEHDFRGRVLSDGFATRERSDMNGTLFDDDDLAVGLAFDRGRHVLAEQAFEEAVVARADDDPRCAAVARGINNRARRIADSPHVIGGHALARCSSHRLSCQPLQLRRFDNRI